MPIYKCLILTFNAEQNVLYLVFTWSTYLFVLLYILLKKPEFGKTNCFPYFQHYDNVYSAAGSYAFLSVKFVSVPSATDEL
jgi:hypothetical protein